MNPKTRRIRDEQEAVVVVRPEVSRHVVAKADEIEPGASKLVTVNGREIGLFNVKGEFYALANRCPHQGGPMCGRRRLVLRTAPANTAWCAGHFGVLHDGSSISAPQFLVRPSPPRSGVRGDGHARRELVKGPVAETFLSVEETIGR
jgi:nitrite reductase/ring-hydroxylating ferredoxin subunit